MGFSVCHDYAGVATNFRHGKPSGHRVHKERRIFPIEQFEHFPLAMLPWVTLDGESMNGTRLDAEGEAGVLVADRVSDTAVVDVTITGGDTETGAGIYCSNSSVTVTHCTITGNQGTNGGGVATRDGASIVIRQSYIRDNDAEKGGGIYCEEHSPPSVFLTFILDNSASDDGGGIYSYRTSPVFTSCVFSGNHALNGGGMALVRSNHPGVNNTLMFQNVASEKGGVIYCYSYGNPTISNTTVTGNTAGTSGGGVYSEYNMDVSLEYDIFWQNQAPEGHEFTLVSNTDLEMNYSDVQGGVDEIYKEDSCNIFNESTCIDADPLFVSGSCGGYYLSQTSAGEAIDSPCLNAGGETAGNVCYTHERDSVCMSDLITRSDNVPDSDEVDLGFHYDVPTPTPAWTPTMTPTSTPAETPTDTPPPSNTPTITPTPTMTPSTGTLSGIVSFERAAPSPDASWITALDVELCVSGGSIATYSVTTDDSGAFTLECIGGRYDVVIKSSHALSAKVTDVSIPYGGISDIIDFGTLPEGDATGDNVVNASDFFRLRNAYNTMEGDENFDPQADFNEDDVVNASDFFLLRSHYNTMGEDC